MNQFLATGGSQGGMGPGATWQPFSVDEQQYAGLVKAIKSKPLDQIKAHARYAWLQPVFDPSLDHIELYSVWRLAVSQPHRARYREEMGALSRKKGGH